MFPNFQTSHPVQNLRVAGSTPVQHTTNQNKKFAGDPKYIRHFYYQIMKFPFKDFFSKWVADHIASNF